ncbi:MAG: hypothetical protein QGF33_12655, partial [Alphaproteobacteria bacterium]|nr:hypothetical protein [Alphaproteobacteria bacterium]
VRVRVRVGGATPGTLRVVGLRWRARGIWGAAAFEARGPALRRTRRERASPLGLSTRFSSERSSP